MALELLSLPLEIGITVSGILFIIRNKVDVPKAPPTGGSSSGNDGGGCFGRCCGKKKKGKGKDGEDG